LVRRDITAGQIGLLTTDGDVPGPGAFVDVDLPLDLEVPWRAVARDAPDLVPAEVGHENLVAHLERHMRV
jgi:hypothetical protein